MLLQRVVKVMNLLQLWILNVVRVLKGLCNKCGLQMNESRICIPKWGKRTHHFEPKDGNIRNINETQFTETISWVSTRTVNYLENTV